MNTNDPSDNGSDGPNGDRDGTSDELTEEEAEELINEIERRRSLQGVAAVAVAAIGILFSVFQLFLAARGFSFTVWLPIVDNWEVSLQLLQANAVHVSFALVLTFLLFPASMGDGIVTRNLGRIVPVASRRLGDQNPITRLLAGVRATFRWAFLDPDRERVTPFDLLCIVASILSGGDPSAVARASSCCQCS